MRQNSRATDETIEPKDSCLMNVTSILGYWRSLLLLLLIPSIVTGADDFAAIQPLVRMYCVGCHGAEKQKGDVRFDRLAELDTTTFEAIYEQLASGQMPPDDQRQPTKTQRAALMQRVLDLAKKGPPVTAPGLRRLNKREYGNTVRDLLGLHKGIFDPGEYIYDDEIDEGFDTAAESLVISNELLLEYMGAAEKSLRHALFTAESEKPSSKVIDVRLSKVQGTSSRYINNHRDNVIGRSGGNAKLFDGEATRTVVVPGRYTITVTAAGVDRDTYPVRFTPERGPLTMGFGIAPDDLESVSNSGRLIKTFDLKDDVDQTFQFDTWIDKGHFPYFSFVNGSSKPITQVRAGIRRKQLKASAMNEPYAGPGIRISQFKIKGPFHDKWPPESIRTTYDSDKVPDLTNTTAREQLVLRFATRAFRRRVTVEELAPYFNFLNQQYARNRDWHDSIIRTFAAMMASVDFLYLREGHGELDDDSLANRLSYFLWSTMPDAELSALARSGKLNEPAVLSQQVNRLLGDERSTRFSNSFTDQWLSLDTLGTMPPDVKSPEFKDYFRDELEPSMLEETRRFFRHVLRENLSVRDFIESDYSFINKGLAKLYGVPFEGDDEFVRVKFPQDAKRGGLLGHGSILTLTSNGVETSPVVRGVWVLADLLGTPPPPPPKEVPAITPDLNGAKTVRDLLEKHRSDAACMECHRRMDPLGFALEAYDPIGRLRTRYSEKQTLTTHGSFMGQDFADVNELKQILARDIRPFARSLVVRIVEYAKGRKLVAADYAAVEAIVDQTAKDDFRLKDIVTAVATSELLKNR